MITIGPYIYNDEEDLISSFKNTLKPKYAGKKVINLVILVIKILKNIVAWFGSVAKF